jgi:uroporphyrinogen-III synthase
MRVASIGPETSRALRALGVGPTVEADPHTVPGLVEAIRTAVGPRRLASNPNE